MLCFTAREEEKNYEQKGETLHGMFICVHKYSHEFEFVLCVSFYDTKHRILRDSCLINYMLLYNYIATISMYVRIYMQCVLYVISYLTYPLYYTPILLWYSSLFLLVPCCTGARVRDSYSIVEPLFLFFLSIVSVELTIKLCLSLSL